MFEAADRERLRKSLSGMDSDGTASTSLYSKVGPYAAQHDEVLDLFGRMPNTKRRPVTLFAAVHYLILQGERHPLAQIYEAPEARGALAEAGPRFVDFCREYADEIIEVVNDHTIQTNEVNRCVGLLPALMEAARQSHKPLALIELGASAGLNLLFDRFRYDYAGGPVIGPPGATVRLSTQIRGKVPKLDSAAPMVEHSVGIDLNPVDIFDEEQELWLRACVWAGEVARDQRLTAALDLARREWPKVERGNVLAQLSEMVSDVDPNLELCLFNSQMMRWMSQPDRERLSEVVHNIALLRPVWWVTLEGPSMVPGLADPDGIEPDTSVLGLQHLSPSGSDVRVLARIQHHGVWLDWLDPATTAW